MKDIDIKLKAKNSDGEQVLWLVEDNNEYWFTLVGDYDKKPIQIDFDIVDRKFLEEMKTQIELILED